MRRALVIAATSLAIGGCTNMSLPNFELPSLSSPAASTLEFESQPAGADVKTSTGQACKTPCSLAVTASELTATFSLNGYQPQTVPIRTAAGTSSTDSVTGEVGTAQLSPNPVYAELTPAPVVRPRVVAPTPAAPAKPKKKPKATAAAKPKPEQQQQPPAQQPMTAAPQASPASPWPAPQR